MRAQYLLDLDQWECSTLAPVCVGESEPQFGNSQISPARPVCSVSRSISQRPDVTVFLPEIYLLPGGGMSRELQRTHKYLDLITAASSMKVL